jgi:CubicO group peptidase (beta-lactamase class C family)
MIMRIHPRFVACALAGALLQACSAPDAARSTAAAAAPPAADAPALPPPIPLPSNETLAARAKPLELDTQYEPPPGDPLEHHTSGYAKTMCSAVFITGLDPDVAAESVGYFTGPYEERKKVGKPVVDREKKEVRITLPNGVVVTARHFGSQGCITLPPGHSDVFFKPVGVARQLPDAKTTPWPMGDVLPQEPPPAGVDMEKVKRAIDAAFNPADSLTSAFVVTHNGRLIGERYMPGITETTPLESWSMGKSVTATMMGILIRQGVYTLDQPAPIPEWQKPNDPRRTIRIQDLLRMSSGIRIKAPDDPESTGGTYPDHLYLYTGRVDSFKYAATRPPQWPPNTVGRYRNTDPVLTNYLVRLAVEKRGEEYLSFPQRQLFDKIGVRSMVMETDPYGNFLTQGYELMSGRDWARLGNLYLQDGVWNGERILPERFAAFVSTVAPAWAADGRPVYGGFFWINGDQAFPVPREAYYMSGAGGQTVLIVPSHGLVVVRIGHYKGVQPGTQAFRRALAILMEAVPPRGSLPPRT